MQNEGRVRRNADLSIVVISIAVLFFGEVAPVCVSVHFGIFILAAGLLEDPEGLSELVIIGYVCQWPAAGFLPAGVLILLLHDEWVD